MMFVLVTVGFLLLLGGAEILVRGSVAIARQLEVSTLVIGMTVVAFGTSAPELVVSVNAALNDTAGIAVGNVVGSNIANVLLILGAAGLVHPIAARERPLVRDAAVLAAASILFVALAWNGTLGLLSGAVLLLAFFGFLIDSYRREARGEHGAAGESLIDEVDELGKVKGPGWWPWVLAVGGLIAILIGADLLVEGGVTIARTFGVPEEVIGLTLIAIGTSLPELAASVVAALRGHADVAVGNVIGSNLFNILGVAGTVAVMTSVAVPEQIRLFDSWVMLVATLVLLPFLVGGWRFGRRAGVIFLAAYAVYIALQAHGVSDLL